MKRIKIDGTTVKIPESWDEITLGFYETWYHRQPATTREKVELAAEICRIKPERLLSARADTFNRIARLLAFAFNNEAPTPSPMLTAKGVKYTVTPSAELTLAQWVDADEAQHSGEKPLSSLLAIVCLPPGEKYDPSRFNDRQQLFASLKMSETLGVLGFFFTLRQHIARTFESLFADTTNRRPVAAEYKSFSDRWGWYKVIADLAGDKILSLDAVVALPATQVFTFISYLNEKAAAEDSQQTFEKQLGGRFF